MRAIVLVGGEGTRLRPLTFTTPKPLLPIANVAFLERQLAWLGRHGVDEVVLSLGYLPDAFVAHFPEGRCGDIRLGYAVEDDPLGTAGGIRYAADEAGINERFIVCNGDVLTELDLSALVRFHEARGAEATIHLARVPDPSAFGVVPTHEDGEVKAFVEKPPPGRAPTDWINAGTYVLEPSVLDRIPSRLSVSIERETFPRMLEDPGRLYASPSDAYWIDIGTPEKFLEAHRDVLTLSLGPHSLPPDAVERTAGVWVQGEISLAEDARVEPPMLIGAGATVASGARVAGSVLGTGSVVGEGARIERSVLLDRARVAPAAAVTDSVVGYGGIVDRGAAVSDHMIIEDDGVVPSTPGPR
jgi:mannose-1-phosphate guanylyltransferase